MPQTITEKVVQAHSEGLEPGHEVQAGDMVTVRPFHVMTHDNTGAVLPKFHTIGAKRVADPSQPVFTLDHRINPLAIGRPRRIYGLLFRSAADTLLAFARNAKWLGATPGILLFLHTWGQKLDLHIHVHCIVTGGGLTKEGVWRSSKPYFLFPVHAPSQGCFGQSFSKACAGLW